MSQGNRAYWRGLSVIAALVIGLIVYMVSAKTPPVVYLDYQPPEYPPNSGSEHLVGMNGKSLNAVIGQYGLPDKQFEISMDEALLEYRCEVLNWYPPDRPSNKNVRFLETMRLQGDYRVYMWFHRVDGSWVYLTGYKTHKNVRS